VDHADSGVNTSYTVNLTPPHFRPV
jgi:hypothetical protein